MKYVIAWHERAVSSPEYEELQKRILGIFKDWKMPVGCKLHQCLVRVGEFGGYMVVETNSPETGTLGHFLEPVFDRLDPHTLSGFEFRAYPVVDVTDAVVASATS